MGTKQKCRISRHILDAGCYYEEGAFTLSFLPRRLPELFTARFTPSVDFTEGDVFIIKGRRFTVKTRTMEEPAGKLFSAGAVVQCDIDMERNLAFVAPGGEAQAGGLNLGSALPEMNGTASAGSSTNASRGDHVHPSDTSRLALSGGIMTGSIAWAGSNAQIEGGSLTGEWIAQTPTSSSPATAIATKEYVDNNLGMFPNWNMATDISQNNPAFFPTPSNVERAIVDGTLFTAQEDGFLFGRYVLGATPGTANNHYFTLVVNGVVFFNMDTINIKPVSASTAGKSLRANFGPLLLKKGDTVKLRSFGRDGVTCSKDGDLFFIPLCR